MSTSTFFTSDDAIARKLNYKSTLQSDFSNEEINTVYFTKQCIHWILEKGFSSVALQFPDDLLVDAPKVARRIQDEVPNSSVFVLGDTSYGSCCVDEVGAQHYNADCIIHFGSSCLSPTMRLPVLYVFGRCLIDVDDCVSKICQECNDTAMKAVLVYDTKYAFIVDQVFQQLRNCLPHLILSKLSVQCRSFTEKNSIYETMYPDSVHVANVEDQPTASVTRCGRVILLPENVSVDDYTFIFLGDSDGSTVINMMMNFTKSPFYFYNPETSLCERITLNVNKALMKRYYLIERAKDANIVGILIGTLGVAKYRNMMDQLKALLKKAGKKSYTFVVGKLNPQKLANFAEVDVYVLVSCPESCLFDQGDYHCPVVTPFEMEIACNKARDWTGDYTTDFTTLLPGSSMHVQLPETGDDQEEGDVSLISNRLRVMGGRNTVEVVSSSTDVAVRENLSVVQNASEFLSTRSWQGLEQNLGQTQVVKASEGQAGIAASYENEPSH